MARVFVCFFGIFWKLLFTLEELESVYIGCYKDSSSNRAMDHSKTYALLSLQICQRHCMDIVDTTYFGVEFYYECYCANTYDRYGKAANDNECYTDCLGNVSQTCGGNNRLSVYTVCPRGYFATKCRNACNCKDNDICVRLNGSCPNGCQEGWSGNSCSVDINECVTSNGGCQHDCVNSDGTYRCRCPDGYQLQDDQKTCEDINECHVNNGGCQHVCMNIKGFFYCICPKGFIVNSDNKTCVDVKECLRNNGECDQNCINTQGSYYCTCRDGFRLKEDKRGCQVAVLGLFVTPNVVAHEIGSTATFHCEVRLEVIAENATKSTQLKWFYNSSSEMESSKGSRIYSVQGRYTNRLYIKSVSEEDAGIYTCTAVINGETYRKAVTLNVYMLSSVKCGTDWFYDPLSEMCYKTYHVPETYEKAKESCTTDNSSLISIHNQYEQLYVTSIVQSYSLSYFNGAKRAMNISSDWKWSDGMPVQYFNWNPGEPTIFGGSEMCVEMRSSESGGWSDLPCTEKRYFICQKVCTPPVDASNTSENTSISLILYICGTLVGLIIIGIVITVFIKRGFRKSLIPTTVIDHHESQYENGEEIFKPLTKKPDEVYYENCGEIDLTSVRNRTHVGLMVAGDVSISLCADEEERNDGVADYERVSEYNPQGKNIYTAITPTLDKQ